MSLTEEPGRQQAAASPPAPHTSGVLARGRRWATTAPTLLPGVAVAAAITVVATLLGGLAPVIGAPVFAIVLGIIVAAIHQPSQRFLPGLSFSGRQVLQAAIVLLGLELSVRQVLSTGADSLPVIVGTIAAALLLAWLIGRALKLRRDVNILIGVGTAICGASAIAAADAVIDAEDADVSYSIATIFSFNVIAVVAFPQIGHLLGLSQHSFGLWAGTAVNDTSSVVAAASIYGHAALNHGVVVKLTRTLAIIPICVGLALWRQRTRTTAAPAPLDPGRACPPAAAEAPAKRLRFWKVVPAFLVWFIVAVLVNTSGLIPDGWHHGLSDLATWMITAALAAIGLSTKFRNIRATGFRPLALGAMLWVSVAAVSLGLQAATGSL